MTIVFLGLSITSSWGNGHATTYRGLLRELARRGHRILFFERDVPWYAGNRDLPNPDYCEVSLYSSLVELKGFADDILEADAVIVGSYIPEGAVVSRWILENARGVVAFYDIDTPVTLAKLRRDECEYLTSALIPHFDLYLSFTGGPILGYIERYYGARRACALYCSVDPESYFPEFREKRWAMGYLGTYSDDRQPILDELLVKTARKARPMQFIIAGPMYPKDLEWPSNVERIDHLSPSEHRAFYNSQDFTLNVTRRDMVSAGWSPSVRLFEAAACGTPIISDSWEGLQDFFHPGREILIVRSSEEVRAILFDLPEEEKKRLTEEALLRVLTAHTASHRAQELENLLLESCADASPEKTGRIVSFQELNA